MPLPSEVTTRVDQLLATVQQVSHEHRKQTKELPASPMFTREQDGTVRDRHGNKILEGARPKP